MKRLVILGAGALGELVAYHAKNDSDYQIIGFYDDYSEKNEFFNFPILGKTEKIIEDYKKNNFDYIFIAIGYKQMKARKSLFDKFKGIIPIATIIHSSCYVDDSCKIGEGVILLPRVVLDYGVEIGDNVLLNTGSVVAHHSTIGNNSFIAPGVNIAGYVKVASECFIGIGAIIVDMINIKENSTIGAGALVIKNLDENSVSIGSPAKIIRFNEKLD